MNQEKVIPRVYSTGRGPALQHLLLPRRPGQAIGFLTVLILLAGKAASRGARKRSVFLAHDSQQLFQEMGHSADVLTG